MQCDGVAMADAKGDYRDWRVVRGPDRMPVDPCGLGLPTSLVNDILVAKDGTIYAATTTGLAWSKNKGQSWQYVRGKDWADKVRGLYGGAPNGWTERPGAYLAEDYLTCLAEDANGLWVGHRRKGCDLLDPVTGETRRTFADGRFVRGIVPMAGEPLTGSYGEGPEATSLIRMTARSAERPVPLLPAGAQPPTDAELRDALAKIQATGAGTHPNGPAIALLDEDWRTQGNWLGRYGRYWACLAAVDAPRDYLWGTAPRDTVRYRVRQGPHHVRGDTMRAWVHWLYTSDCRSLELPPVYLHSRVVKGLTGWERNRRQAEWDDAGEDYPMHWEGPDLRLRLIIPDGAFCLSLYDINKDGQEGVNRYRDYLVSIRVADNETSEEAGRDREVARTRIRDFWSGCYKRFLVRGPANVTVYLSKNYSYNTILAAVMLDELEPRPEAYFRNKPLAPDPPSSIADRLHDSIGALLHDNPQPVWFDMQALLLRSYCASDDGSSRPNIRIADAMYHLRYFDRWESVQQSMGWMTPRQIEKSLRWDGKILCDSGAEAVILPRVPQETLVSSPSNRRAPSVK